MKSASLLASIVCLTAIGLGAQQPATPPRDAARPAAKPTAAIRGRVTAADSGAPLRRVSVRAVAADPRAGAVAQTDDQGRFEMRELPAGRYTVSAAKGGFVPTQYGQRRPGVGPGTPLELADGQMVERVNIAMVRGGAIAGRILDDGGDPIVGADVVALGYAFISGRRQLTTAGSGDLTDDEGAFRVHGLPAGDYFVQAVVGSAPRSDSNALEALASTFYPGTPQAAEAQRVTVKAGQVTPNVSFALSTTRTVSVSGRVLGSNGQSWPGQVAMGPRDASGVVLEPWKYSETLKPDGTFRFVGVVPGRYVVRVTPQAGDLRDEHGRLELTVPAADAENVLIITAPAGIARGRVTTDEGTPPPLEPGQVRLFAIMADRELDDRRQSWDVKIAGDWSFEIERLVDPVIVRWAAARPGWSLRRVVHDGTDLTDRGLAVPPGGVLEGVEIVLTRKVTEVTGQVTDARGRPVSDATLVVFASNRERWTPESRYIRTARPDPSGNYVVRLVPDTEYLIVAVRDLEDGQAADPEFLDRAIADATRFSIAEGETKALDVKITEPR